MESMDTAVILTVIGVITAITNMLVQVLKQVTWESVPTNLIVLCVAQALTLIAGGAYAQVQGIAIAWYMVCGAVVVGFLVAYAAMFGYDKLSETLQSLGVNAGGD